MMFDYSAIMLNIQNNLADYYSKNSLPCGEGKSLQFERTATEIIRDTFSSADRSSGYSQEYHSVEYLGENVFPDVVVHIGTTGRKIGIEIKYHISGDNWKTKGNSTFASTQVDGLEEIYILFGKFDHNACAIKIRPYGECISGISITHNPRYDIDMDSKVDFCRKELGMSYDDLRQLEPEQRKIHINTYIAKTRYTAFSNINANDKKELITQAFILFPEIFSKNAQIRYNNFSVWLFANNVICKNVRDFLTAGGKDKINGILFPKVYVTFHNHLDHIKKTIGIIPSQVLARAWYGSVTKVTLVPDNTNGRLQCWLNLSTTYHGGDTSLIEKTNLNFKNTLSLWLGL